MKKISCKKYLPVLLVMVMALSGFNSCKGGSSSGKSALWGFGDASEGQLGDVPASKVFGDYVADYNAVKLMEDELIAFSAGGEHNLVIKKDGALWAWGNNEYGRLGDGTTNSSNIPIHIMDEVVAVSAGHSHNLAIKNDGALWAWGFNLDGRLGDGTWRNKSEPVKVLDGVKTISAGSGHSLAVKSDGSLWACGENRDGQLGNGTTNRSNVLIKIMDDVIAISAGSYNSFAVKSDGSLWAWGRNDRGQLGDGTKQNKSEPVKVLDGVKTVSAGGWHSFAIKSDGTLWSNVDNIFKNIMDGVKEVSTGNTISYAIRNDGYLWSDLKNNPTRLMRNVTAVSAGNSHCLYIGTGPGDIILSQETGKPRGADRDAEEVAGLFFEDYTNGKVDVYINEVTPDKKKNADAEKKGGGNEPPVFNKKTKKKTTIPRPTGTQTAYTIEDQALYLFEGKATNVYDYFNTEQEQLDWLAKGYMDKSPYSSYADVKEIVDKYAIDTAHGYLETKPMAGSQRDMEMLFIKRPRRDEIYTMAGVYKGPEFGVGEARYRFFNFGDIFRLKYGFEFDYSTWAVTMANFDEINISKDGLAEISWRNRNGLELIIRAQFYKDGKDTWLNGVMVTRTPSGRTTAEVINLKLTKHITDEKEAEKWSNEWMAKWRDILRS